MYVLGSVSRLSNPSDLSILVLMPQCSDYCLVFPSTAWKCHPLQMAPGVTACFSQTRIHVLNTESTPSSEPLGRSFSEPQGTLMEQFDARFWSLVQQTPRLVGTEVCPCSCPSLSSAQPYAGYGAVPVSRLPQGRMRENVWSEYCRKVLQGNNNAALETSLFPKGLLCARPVPMTDIHQSNFYQSHLS